MREACDPDATGTAKCPVGRDHGLQTWPVNAIPVAECRGTDALRSFGVQLRSGRMVAAHNRYEARQRPRFERVRLCPAHEPTSLEPI